MLARARSAGIPIAIKTCEGSIAPEEQAAPGRDRQPLQIERDDQSLAVDPIKINIAGIRHARRDSTIHPDSLNLQQLPLQPISQRRHLRIISALQPARANSAAFPKPTMPGTFSVPARRERSCRPP